MVLNRRLIRRCIREQVCNHSSVSGSVSVVISVLRIYSARSLGSVGFLSRNNRAHESAEAREDQLSAMGGLPPPR